MLGRLGVGRRTVAIAGTHGKSTATAMLAHLLIQAGLDPTVVCGATPSGASSGGRAGERGQGSAGQGSEVRAQATPNPQLQISKSRSPHPNLPREGPMLLLVEACEYRANFLQLRPWQAAITGIEPDHFDCYDSLAQLEDAFRRFAESIPDDGLLVARHDCQSTRRVTAGLNCRVESFGFSADADWSARTLEEDRGRFRFEIRRFGRRLCEVRLPTPGEHNVLNALAAAALAYENGLSPEQISAGLGSFPGLHRRLELLGIWRGVDVDRRLRPSPDGSDGRLGGGSSHGPPTPGCGAFFSRIRRRERHGCSTNWPRACKMPTNCWWPTFSGRGKAIPSRGRLRRPISPGGPRSSASRSCRPTPQARSSKRWKPSWPPATYWLL